MAKNKTVLVCGSYAFDNIMLFQDSFKNHILPDKIHMLNVSFYVPSMRKEFGGCAGNITYNLHLLGQNPLPMATVGWDFVPYQEKLNSLNINTKYIKTIANVCTAQAFITTDIDDNQITAFHPGAMDNSQLNDISKLKPSVDLAIISPDGKVGMLEHARHLFAMSVPFIFDPGQGLPMFSKSELLTFIKQARWITLNDYELALLVDKTKLSVADISSQVEALVVTKGAKGADIYVDNKILQTPALETEKTLDPTGCGDAYRAGFIFGITQGLDWQKTAQLANLIGAIKVTSTGTQNHNFSLNSIKADYYTNYKTKL